MHLKIYFGDKPVYLTDELNNEINTFIHHPDTVFIDEASPAAVRSLLHEINKSDFHAGILFSKNFDELKKEFFKHFVVIPAAGGLVRNSRRAILMIFRRGKWDLPKGKLDPGETLEKCAVREVEEETGLRDIAVFNKLTVTFHVYHEYGKHFLKESHWYLMEYHGNSNPVPQTEEDILKAEWVDKTNLQTYLNNTYPAIAEVLNNYT